jgi:hypothetical protein
MEEWDITESNTPYHNYITDPKNSIKERILQLMNIYPTVIDDYWIIYPESALAVITKLTASRVAICGVGVWGYNRLQIGTSDPYGMGGPVQHTDDGDFYCSEYVHLSYSVPALTTLSKDLTLSSTCNPLVANYIANVLPKHEHFSAKVRVSLDLYIPMVWNLYSE